MFGFSSWEVALLLFGVFPVLVYALVRVAARAWFRSKFEYHMTLMTQMAKEHSDG